MKRLVVAAEAKADLRDIRRFSTSRWGQGQASEYINQIIARFSWLMVNPSLGSNRDDLGPGLRRVNVRSHAIFYRELEDSIEIARVLHQRMDHARVFGRDPN